MLQNYLKIAWRNLSKNRLYSTVNIFGLAIGMTACLLLWQYVRFEKSYDQFHTQKDRLYRVAMYKYEKGEPEQDFAFTYPAVAPNLKKDFPEIEEAIRMRQTRFIVKYEDQIHPEFPFFVDEPFLEMFSFPMVVGDPATALEGANSVVISERIAKKYFGEAQAMDQTIMLEANGTLMPFQVSAVMEDTPENSHMKLDLLMPYKTYSNYVTQFGGDAENNWGWSDFYTYVLLKPGTDAEALSAKLPAFIRQYKGEEFDQYGFEIALRLQSVPDIHLTSDLGYELRVNGNAKYVFFLGIIALFILMIAWVNYINLSTARAMDRAREVGVRKVSGATKGQLVRQFLFETGVVNVIAFMMALSFFYFGMPYFELLSGKPLGEPLLQDPSTWVVMLGILGTGILLAGLYPAFVLSSFRPIRALKKMVNDGGKGQSTLRKGLVVFQFATSIALIASTFAMFRQLQFMQNRSLGINIDQTLVLRDNSSQDSSFVSRVAAFKTDLLANPSIQTFTASGDVPGKEVGGSSNLRRIGDENQSLKRCRIFEVDTEFFTNYDLELVAGRSFEEDRGTDDQAVILNETGVKVLGFKSPEDAIGKEIAYPSGEVVLPIIGVIKDYHQESLKFNFKPIVYQKEDFGWNYYSLKVNTAENAKLISFVENQWKVHFPNTPLSHFFLDDFFNRQYQSDQRFGWIVSLFSSLAIIIACLGLFGLSAFSIRKRTKEIGVRKVLGAQVDQILLLLSKDYFRLILIASMIALPLAFWGITTWLKSYAYAIELGIWFYVLPVLAVLFIAALTVCYQSIKAAFANPIKALRYE